MVDPSSPEFLASSAWRRLRFFVLTKRGNRCECCGASPATGAVMNVDHVKPRKTHPHLALEESNLQVLCDACNHGKGNWSTKDWRPVSGYFFNADSKRRLAHLWDGKDTLCRQWSAGAISKARGWKVQEHAEGKRICALCLSKAKR
jgi:hypothetical protein